MPRPVPTASPKTIAGMKEDRHQVSAQRSRRLAGHDPEHVCHPPGEILVAYQFLARVGTPDSIDSGYRQRRNTRAESLHVLIACSSRGELRDTCFRSNVAYA